MHEASNLMCLVRSVEEQEAIPQLKLNTQMIMLSTFGLIEKFPYKFCHSILVNHNKRVQCLHFL